MKPLTFRLSASLILLSLLSSCAGLQTSSQSIRWFCHRRLTRRLLYKCQSLAKPDTAAKLFVAIQEPIAEDDQKQADRKNVTALHHA